MTNGNGNGTKYTQHDTGFTVKLKTMTDIPPVPGKWSQMYDDIRLRLENTPNPQVLEYTLDSPQAVTAAASALRRMLQQQYGKDGVWSMKARGNCLYVYRGENYGEY